MKLYASLACALLLAGCSTPPGPCRTMNSQIKEKEALDTKVKKTARQMRDFRKQGDTASAASAERRLNGMLEEQRLLKESLEQSSRDCSPTLQDPVPVRDPASHDALSHDSVPK